MRAGFLAAPVALVLIGVGGDAARAQSLRVIGYLQTVPVVTALTPIGDRTVADFSRFRLSTEPPLGPVSIGTALRACLDASTCRRRVPA